MRPWPLGEGGRLRRSAGSRPGQRASRPLPVSCPATLSAALSATRRGIAIALVAACAACAAAPAPETAPPAPEAATLHIHVIRRGEHTGIAVRAADLPPGSWPAQRDLPGAQHYEVGWGDRDYYRAPDPGLWLGLNALFGGRPGTLHLAALDGPVAGTPGALEVVALPVSAAGLARLVARVRDSHERDAAGRAVDLGPGHYGRSRFYGSREVFGIARTCNVWTATRLAEAGVPVGPERPLTAGALMDRLRAIGRRVGPSP